MNGFKKYISINYSSITSISYLQEYIVHIKTILFIKIILVFKQRSYIYNNVLPQNYFVPRMKLLKETNDDVTLSKSETDQLTMLF